MSANPGVSITVVAYNSDRSLGACLRSVRAAVESGVAELIVVDNASPDRSAELVAAEFPEARLIRSPVNRGFAGGCNLAWPEARGRYWLLLNPDVVVPPRGIETLVAWMDQHPEIGAASPELEGDDGRSQSAARRFPSIWRTLLELSRLHLLLPGPWRADVLLGPYRESSDDHLDVDWVPGTALCVRRGTVERVGLLSEELFMYGEDIEWCWRMHQRGERLGVCGALRFRHTGGESARRTWTDDERSARMWRGGYQCDARLRGALHARLLLLANAAALWIESRHPRRSADARERARRDLRIHRDLWSHPSWSAPAASA